VDAAEGREGGPQGEGGTKEKNLRISKPSGRAFLSKKNKKRRTKLKTDDGDK